LPTIDYSSIQTNPYGLHGPFAVPSLSFYEKPLSSVVERSDPNYSEKASTVAVFSTRFE
jgi:hypothetical protein